MPVPPSSAPASNLAPAQPFPRAGSTMPEIAQRLRCSIRQAYKLAQRGEFQTFMLGGHRLGDDDSVGRYIERCKGGGQRFGPTPEGLKKARGRPKDQQPTTARALAG